MKDAKILELLNNPNIVRFKEVYRTVKQKLNIVMEYAEDGDLAQHIKEAKQKGEHFEEEQILRWFVQICLGVKHIHERKIIHRDLKAPNIFLTNDGVVKIGDFGVARGHGKYGFKGQNSGRVTLLSVTWNHIEQTVFIQNWHMVTWSPSLWTLRSPSTLPSQ